MKQNIINRLKSPVFWLAVAAMAYTTLLQPRYEFLPDWTNLAGYAAVLFGIANNPTEHDCF